MLFSQHFVLGAGDLAKNNWNFLNVRRLPLRTKGFERQAIATVLCTPFAFYRWTPPVTAVEWLLVALITGLSLTGNTLLVRSYQYGPASLIAPFIYLQLIWAALFGWLIFSAFPDGWSLAGMITIVAPVKRAHSTSVHAVLECIGVVTITTASLSSMRGRSMRM